jgi:hypothetical protein
MRYSWTYCIIVASSGLLIQSLWPQARSPQVKVTEPPNQTSAIAKTPFLNWLDSEGIPVYRGFEVDDVAAVPVGEWKRYSVKGAMVYLDGSEGVTTGVVWEIAPGQKSIPVHHIFEGRVVVVAGSGETKFWQDGGKPLTALWHHGTLFPLPMNVWYQFINTGKEPARLFAITNAPLLMDTYRDMDFIFNSPQKFTDHFDGSPDYFKPEPPEFKVTLQDRLGYAVSRTNLVPDVLAVKLYPAGHGELYTAWRKAGGSGTMNHHYSMAFDALDSHVEQFQPAAYEIAHRHLGGVCIMYLSGNGYTLLWPKEAGDQPFASGHGDQVVKVRWHANTVFIPPTDWYHQHFNPTNTPAKFLKVASFESRVFPLTARELFKEHANVISYDKQDPKINEIFAEELKTNGVESAMPTAEEINKRAKEHK